jgi:PKD repeat protein
MNANTAVTATYGIAPYIQDVRITSPQDGAVLNSSYMMVRGTVTASSADIGITANGYPADIHNGNWVVNGVPLAEGVNTITVIAKDANNNTLTKNITVVKTQSDGVQLKANLTSGAPPLAVYFVARTSTQNQVQLYEMDFTGTGSFTSIGQSFENVTYTYTAEGIYYPVLRVTDSGGNIFTNTIAITVVSKAKLNILLTQKWEGMKMALKQKNIEGALVYFSERSKAKYRQIFEALKDPLSATIEAFEGIAIDEIYGGVAFYRLTSRENGILYSYPGRMVIDGDGIWKFLDF